MSALRPRLPVFGAGTVTILLLVLGTHIRHIPAELPPLPHVAHVRQDDIADLGAELSAPLFAPSRSVAPVGGDTAATPQTPPPLLSGIVLGGGKAVALVKSASGGDTLMLHAGDAIDGWTIMGIAARQIVVARGGAQQAVALEFGTSKTEAHGDSSPSTAGAAPAYDGLAAATHLGLPATHIPLGSPLAPPR